MHCIAVTFFLYLRVSSARENTVIIAE